MPPVPARAFNFAIDVEHVKRVENELAEKKRARTEREKPLAELQKELLTHRRKLNEVQNESVSHMSPKDCNGL